MLVFFLVVLAGKLDVKEYLLDNGLQLLVYEDHSAPVVSAQIWYRVGSYNEPLGHTGISHLLEHMAYKGTKRVAGKDYSKIIERNGGDENGMTSRHYTCYFANMARDRYQVELELEADRMQNLLIDSADFVPEKGVVMEERRLGENDPLDALWEELFAVAYRVHPYKNQIVGWMDDLERTTYRDVRDYYRMYYNPANALIMLSGDIDPEPALKLVSRLFGGIKGRAVTEIVYREPPQRGERRFRLKRSVETQALMIGYHIPDVNQADAYTLDVISYIMTRGKSSRLYRKLVYEERAALSVSGGAWSDKYPGIFYLMALPQMGKELTAIEAVIYQELDRLKTEPVGDDELERVKNQVLADFVFSKDGVTRMGFEIASAQITTGSYTYLETYEERIARVSKDDIMSAAQKYFAEDNRTVGVLVPEPVAAPAEEEK